MHIITEKHLSRAAGHYPDAAKEISAWRKIAKAARWRSFVEVQQTFKDADAVKGYVIFNLRQNRYRLVTIIHFSRVKGWQDYRGTRLYPVRTDTQGLRRFRELGSGGSKMSTALAKPAEMIRRGAPHLIHSDKELAEYTKALFELTAKSNRTRDEVEAIELLTLLIERYESEHYPIADADPVAVLRFLLERNGLSQRDIAAELGSESTVSLILAGKRRLNLNHIERLSERFHVSPAVFFAAV